MKTGSTGPSRERKAEKRKTVNMACKQKLASQVCDERRQGRCKNQQPTNQRDSSHRTSPHAQGTRCTTPNVWTRKKCKLRDETQSANVVQVLHTGAVVTRLLVKKAWARWPHNTQQVRRRKDWWRSVPRWKPISKQPWQVDR